MKEEKIATLLAALEECMLVMEEERMRKAKQLPTIASKCQVANALCKVLVLALIQGSKGQLGVAVVAKWLRQSWSWLRTLTTGKRPSCRLTGARLRR